MHFGVEGEDSESETKFDYLVSVIEMWTDSNFLSRVPSVKNMRSMQTLSLQSNKITMIASEDFLGATQLLQLLLGNNLIISAAPNAFTNLASFRVAPEAFSLTNADGSPVLPSYGIGACPFGRSNAFLALLVQGCRDWAEHATTLPSGSIWFAIA